VHVLVFINYSWYQFISFTAVRATGGKGGSQFNQNLYLHDSRSTRPVNYQRGHLNKTIRLLRFLEATLVAKLFTELHPV